MTKRKSASAPEAEEQLPMVEPEADEEAPEELAAAEEGPDGAEEPKGKKKRAKEPKRNRSDLVRVRFGGEMGLLAGKAVYNGEVHQVRYWQYLKALETGGEAYQLVED